MVPSERSRYTSNLSVSGPLRLEVTNWRGTVMVLDSNLTGTFFFQAGNIPFQKKLSAVYLSAYVLSAYLPNRRKVFSCYAQFIL